MNAQTEAARDAAWAARGWTRCTSCQGRGYLWRDRFAGDVDCIDCSGIGATRDPS